MIIRLGMKIYHVILTEKEEKYQHHHQVKFINTNITREETLPSDQRKVTEQVYIFFLEKTLEKQTKTIKD